MPAPTASQAAFDGLKGKLNFSTAPFEHDIEVTGSLAATLYVATTARDADLFLTVRAFAPDGKEHLIVGAVDPRAPLAQGWLRASHRKLDSEASRPYRPVHTHESVEALEPGNVYELQVEIWPLCFVFPKGYSAGADGGQLGLRTRPARPASADLRQGNARLLRAAA
ncbi:CocE/NonD family hydrolase C-terminal non-catalytic domain-containing protein [Variovorax guangxiensis]|uniref:CocE/NonD family hydrolase C-terminal non-catalytic domain-containing protein n=1 Tax=Variovorax guangxiensis TaxID=1775474 RepID=UPI00286A7D27|nr:CocE/NonD family hydrolase C-terminal non-catalytic domain-containing protein [Variovorax guangxiensis]